MGRQQRCVLLARISRRDAAIRRGCIRPMQLSRLDDDGRSEERRNGGGHGRNGWHDGVLCLLGRKALHLWAKGGNHLGLKLSFSFSFSFSFPPSVPHGGSANQENGRNFGEQSRCIHVDFKKKKNFLKRKKKKKKKKKKK